MEFLKDVLGEELYREVEKKLNGNSDIKLANLADGGYVSKEKFRAEQQKVSNLTTQLEEKDTQLAGLQDVDADKLNAEITRLQDENKSQRENYEKQIATQQRDYAIASELTSAKARNSRAVKALLDDSKITIGEDGTIRGLREQLQELQRSDSYLFDTAVDTGGGGNPPNVNPTINDVNKLDDNEYYMQVFNKGE